MSVTTDYVLSQMAHSSLGNYIVPGLTSWLLSAPSEKGCVRMFVSTRDQDEFITPHSHRFDFTCHVLEGEVINTMYCSPTKTEPGEVYQFGRLIYGDEPGKHEQKYDGERALFRKVRSTYRAGAWYSMGASEIHSIRFSKGARVLFFEGPCRTNETVILLPVAYGDPVPTFRVADWMYRKDVA